MLVRTRSHFSRPPPRRLALLAGCSADSGTGSTPHIVEIPHRPLLTVNDIFTRPPVGDAQSGPARRAVMLASADGRAVGGCLAGEPLEGAINLLRRLTDEPA